MPAYIVNQLNMLDPSYQKEYHEKVRPITKKYGGKQIVVGPPVAKLEGDWELPERVAILEFPSVEKALAWHNDPDYQALKALRQSGSDSKLMLVDGVE